MKKYIKKIAFIAVIILISITLGVFIGMELHKRQMQGSAIAYWMMGVDSLEKGDYDYALIYLSVAIGLKSDDASFYQAMAEVYEAKQNLPMALEFYKLALDGYKKEKTGPIKLMGHKIELLREKIKGDKKRGQGKEKGDR